jgi:DNA-binding beta-propeller fold protein YncE
VLAVWGGTGSGPGQFSYPEGIAIDRRGRVYVTDFGNQRIEIFSREGKYVGEWKAVDPYGIATGGSGNVFVAEGRPYCAVREYTATGVYRRSFGGGCGTAQNQAQRVRDVAVDSHGDVYLTDVGNDRVVKYSPGGLLLGIWE